MLSYICIDAWYDKNCRTQFYSSGGCNGARSQGTTRFSIENYEDSDSLQFIFINENGLPSSGPIAIQRGDTLNIPFQEIAGTTNEGELILLSENSMRLEIVIDNGIGVLNCDATLFREWYPVNMS